MEYQDRCYVEAMRYAFKNSGFRTQKSLAAAADVSVSTVNEMLMGRRMYGSAIQVRIAKTLGYEIIEFLVLGRALIETGSPPQPGPLEQNLVIEVPSPKEQQVLQKNSEFYRGIPLYESGRLAAGTRGLQFDPYEEPASTVVVYKPELKGRTGNNLAALRVGGDSMKPTIVPGSIIVVDLDDKHFLDRRIFVVKVPDGGDDMLATVKRVRMWSRGFFLVSDNPDYAPEPTELDWLDLCVGRVIWQWRDIREA